MIDKPDAAAEATASPHHKRDAKPAEKIVEFAREHPALVIAGGLAAGLLAGVLLNRRGAGRLARNASSFAKAASSAGIALGHEYFERAEKATRSGSKQLRARTSEAGNKAADMADRGTELARKAGMSIARKALEIAANAKR